MSDDGAGDCPKQSGKLLFLEIVAFAASYGAMMGAAVTAMPWARWAACIGGGVWGVVSAVVQMRFSHRNTIRNRTQAQEGLGTAFRG